MKNIGPMIVFASGWSGSKWSVPFEKIDAVHYCDEGSSHVKIAGEVLGIRVAGTVSGLTASINAQLADHARACSTMVVEMPNGGE